jgi:predicted anti-sigma-YlaC factor YlaD
MRCRSREHERQESVNCSDVRQYLITHEEVVLDLPADIAQHLNSCARCRLEFEQNRNLAADLRLLAEQDVEVPVWLQSTLTEATLERVRRKEAIRATGRQLVRPRVLGGALLLAGVAGLLVRSKRRPSVRQAPAAA